MGIANYNEECRGIAQRYVDEWEKTVVRMGSWIDFRNDYKTMDLKFMESVWWGFAQLFQKGLVYRGFKVMPYSTGCKTLLSNFEANSNYKEVPDPKIMVAFPVIDDPDGASFVAWTTTPWKLPGNLALCVNANFVYVKVRNKVNGKVYVVNHVWLSFLLKRQEKACQMELLVVLKMLKLNPSPLVVNQRMLAHMRCWIISLEHLLWGKYMYLCLITLRITLMQHLESFQITM